MTHRLISIRLASLFDEETSCSSDSECLNGGHCQADGDILNDSNHPDVFDSNCICDQAYTGHYCEQPKVANPPTVCGVDEDCQNGGKCNYSVDTNTPLGRCECPVTHYGFRCEEKCPCIHEGTCLTLPSSGRYQCQCTDEFIDALCATRLDGVTLADNNTMMRSIMGFSFGIFFFLIWIASITRSGIGGAGNNEKGEEEGDSRMVGAGNPGVERLPDGGIVYCNGKNEEGLPIREDLSMDDTLSLSSTLSDIELT